MMRQSALQIVRVLYRRVAIVGQPGIAAQNVGRDGLFPLVGEQVKLFLV